MNKYLLNGLYGLLALIGISAFAFKVFQPIQVLPRIRLSPAFDMLDQDWKRLTNEDLRGQMVLYTFTYTNCPAPCHDIDKTMQEIQARLNEADLGETKMSFVTISFDPQNDSPLALRAHAEGLNADPQQWKFVTSPNETLLKTIIGSGFHAYYEKNTDNSFTFDPTFILVDGWGIVRGEYRYQTEVSTVDRILRHISVLADEVQNSTGPQKVAYEAAHLFLCYAP